MPDKHFNMSIGECGILVDYKARAGYMDAGISGAAMAARELPRRTAAPEAATCPEADARRHPAARGFRRVGGGLPRGEKDLP